MLFSTMMPAPIFSILSKENDIDDINLQSTIYLDNVIKKILKSQLMKQSNNTSKDTN